MHLFHDQSHAPEQEGDRTLAKLSYLYDHNCHHAEELAAMAEGLDGQAGEKLRAAAELYAQANEQLHLALHALEEQ